MRLLWCRSLCVDIFLEILLGKYLGVEAWVGWCVFNYIRNGQNCFPHLYLHQPSKRILVYWQSFWSGLIVLLLPLNSCCLCFLFLQSFILAAFLKYWRLLGVGHRNLFSLWGRDSWWWFTTFFLPIIIIIIFFYHLSSYMSEYNTCPFVFRSRCWWNISRS